MALVGESIVENTRGDHLSCEWISNADRLRETSLFLWLPWTRTNREPQLANKFLLRRPNGEPWTARNSKNEKRKLLLKEKKKKKRNKKKSLDRLIVLFCGIFNEGILRCGTVTDFIQASYGPIRVCVCIWPICVCGLRSCTRGRTSKLDDRSVADVDIDITGWPERLISPCHCFRWSVLPRHDRG